MKKLVLMFALLLLIPQYAASSQEASVSISAPSTISPGSEFYVYVEAENLTDFNAADYSIIYNSSIFEVNAVYNGSIGGVAIPVNFSVNNTTGICRVVQHIGTDGIDGSGYLSKILFICNEEGYSSIDIRGNLSNVYGNEIHAIWNGKNIISTSTILKIDAPDSVNGDFNASVCIYNVTDFSSINMTLAYNDSFLYPKKVENGWIAGNEVNISYNLYEGKIRIVGLAGKADGDGYITNITFGAKRAGITYLNISDITISNSSSCLINAFIENKSIFVESAGPGYPVAAFTWEPSQPRDIDEIKFNANSSYDINGFIANYTWNFGDGNVSYEQNPSHKYADNGTYNVMLTVTDNDGLTNITTKSITVKNVPPAADFIFEPSNPTSADTIHFTDLSNDPDGFIVNYTWNFGDGNVSYEQNPSHKYADNGTYNVTLTVTDNDGAANSTSKEIIFAVNHPPDSPSNPSPYDGETDVKINSMLTWQCSDLDGDSLTYDIYLGTSPNPPQVASGTASTSYNPGLLDYETTYYWKVVASDGRATTSGQTWHFTTKANSPPTKPALSGPSSGYTGYVLTFYALSTDQDGNRIKYGFDWNNDGLADEWTDYYAAGTEGSISHSWNSEGAYYIKVKAKDEWGAESEWSNVKVINIQKYIPPPPPPKSPPAADFSFDMDDLNVSFYDMSSDSDGSVVNWTWDFGDGNVSYEKNPVHRYSKYENYTVKLTVRDNDGLTDEASKKVSIHLEIEKNPDVVLKSIDILPSSPHEGEKIEFAVKISNEGNGDALNVTISYMLDGKLLNSSSLGKLSAGESIEKSFYLDTAKGSHEFSASVSDGIHVDKKTINFEVSAAGEKTFSVWIVAAIAILGVAAGAYIAFRKRRK